jgi:hypothetical protein
MQLQRIGERRRRLTATTVVSDVLLLGTYSTVSCSTTYPVPSLSTVMGAEPSPSSTVNQNFERDVVALTPTWKSYFVTKSPRRALSVVVTSRNLIQLAEHSLEAHPPALSSQWIVTFRLSFWSRN